MRTLALLAVLILAGCSSQARWTPDQRLLVQSRLFKGVPKRLVLRAMVTVLQDEGYSIKREDPEKGVVMGSKPVAVPVSGKLRKPKLLANESFEVAMQATEADPGLIETRVSVQRLATDSFGDVDGREVLMLGVYRAIYGKVRAEVGRLVARGGLEQWSGPGPALPAQVPETTAPKKAAAPPTRR